MSIFSDWDFPVFLFKFSDDVKLQVPLYTEVVDRSWNPSDLDKIVNYLRQGRVVTSTPAFDSIICPICEETIEQTTSSQQSDGRWIWLSSLSHYVQFHNIRLPDRMVEQIRSNDYRLPT